MKTYTMMDYDGKAMGGRGKIRAQIEALSLEDALRDFGLDDCMYNTTKTCVAGCPTEHVEVRLPSTVARAAAKWPHTSVGEPDYIVESREDVEDKEPSAYTNEAVDEQMAKTIAAAIYELEVLQAHTCYESKEEWAANVKAHEAMTEYAKMLGISVIKSTLDLDRCPFCGTEL